MRLALLKHPDEPPTELKLAAHPDRCAIKMRDRLGGPFELVHCDDKISVWALKEPRRLRLKVNVRVPSEDINGPVIVRGAIQADQTCKELKGTSLWHAQRWLNANGYEHVRLGRKNLSFLPVCRAAAARLQHATAS